MTKPKISITSNVIDPLTSEEEIKKAEKAMIEFAQTMGISATLKKTKEDN